MDNVDLSTSIGLDLSADGRGTCGQCGQLVFRLSNLSTNTKDFLGKGKGRGEKCGQVGQCGQPLLSR